MLPIVSTADRGYCLRRVHVMGGVAIWCNEPNSAELQASLVSCLVAQVWAPVSRSCPYLRADTCGRYSTIDGAAFCCGTTRSGSTARHGRTARSSSTGRSDGAAVVQRYSLVQQDVRAARYRGVGGNVHIYDSVGLYESVAW